MNAGSGELRLTQRYNAAQTGFTVIELMVALVINLILVGGILQIFGGSVQVFRTQETQSTLLDNARLALELLKRDIRMADNWNCSPAIANRLAPTGAGFLDVARSSLTGVDGLNDSPDTIRIAAVESKPYTLLAAMTSPTDGLTIAGGSGLKQGDIIVVNDCRHSDLLQITNDNADATGTLEHTTIGPVSPGNVSDDLSYSYAAGSQVFRVRQVEYRIERDADNEPALVRVENGEAQRLVVGVEDLQILYGQDLNADRAADRYIPAAQITDFRSIVSVRFEVLMRSDQAVASSAYSVQFNGVDRVIDDRHLRKTFTSTISVRNRQS